MEDGVQLTNVEYETKEIKLCKDCKFMKYSHEGKLIHKIFGYKGEPVCTHKRFIDRVTGEIITKEIDCLGYRTYQCGMDAKFFQKKE